MEVSWHDGDNFIRNAVTVRCGGRRLQPTARKMTRDVGLPVPLDDLMLDLRIDSEDHADTLERIQRGCCDFIERRTGHVILPGTYQVDLGGWWGGDLEIMRGPLRELTGISYLAGANDDQQADLEGFYVHEDDRSFSVRPLTTFDRPTLWSEVGRVRLSFSAGYHIESVSGETEDSDLAPPLQDGLRTILIALCGHYYRNVELFEAGKLEQLELGGMAFLGTYRQFW